MKKPHHFSLTRENITPNKRVGCPRKFFSRNCRLVQINIGLIFTDSLPRKKRQFREKRGRERPVYSRAGWDSQWKSMGCVVGVR
jgi:hypothetical protein